MVQSSQRHVIFYDGECSICRREIEHYQRLDKQQRIQWHDITRQPGILSELNPPVSYQTAMTRLHVLDGHGQMHTGVDAFICLWRELPYYHWLASILAGLGLIPLLEKFYGYFTRLRLRNRCLTGKDNCH